MTPRPYQSAAMAALDAWLAANDGNPCVVLPTGAGKTPCMAWTNRRYVEGWPGTRILTLARSKELLSQGVDKMRVAWPDADIGVYSAGLKRWHTKCAITYAGIQSIYDKACEFDPWDIIHIDEAHNVSLKDEGQYRRFVREAKLANPHVRVVGWTATPYRLAGGMVCHRDYILNEVCYEANVKVLINAGYLASLRTKLGAGEIDTTGIKKSGGDFNKKQLEAVASVDATVDGIAAESVSILDREDRKSAIYFCCTVDHAEKMSRALGLLGLDAPTIHQGTNSTDRAERIQAFTAGRLRAVCNVNVLSEGFDAIRVDAVVLVRPTESKGLYYQQVGRGLRLHPGKTDCLVLDFAGNVARHGPIDVLSGDRPHMVTCGSCRERFAAAVLCCPACGWEIPPEPAPEGTGGERPERIIPSDPKARTEAEILSSDVPREIKVVSVAVRLHEKPGKPASLQVTYRGLMESVREWVCLGHEGYARRKAEAWWRARFPGEVVPASAIEVNCGLLEPRLAAVTEAVIVRRARKYTEIVSARLRGRELEAVKQ